MTSAGARNAELLGLKVEPPTPGPVRMHEIKCWPAFFGPLVSGEKTFEIRWNDRNYAPGDQLWLREWEMPRYDSNHPLHVPGKYTGREAYAKITFVVTGKERHAVIPGYCVMSIQIERKE